MRACPPPARSPPPTLLGPSGTLGGDSDPILPTREQKQRESMFWPKAHREKVIQWLSRNSNTHYATMPSTFQKIPEGSIIPNLPLLTHLTPRVPLPQRTVDSSTSSSYSLLSPRDPSKPGYMQGRSRPTAGEAKSKVWLLSSPDARGRTPWCRTHEDKTWKETTPETVTPPPRPDPRWGAAGEGQGHPHAH